MTKDNRGGKRAGAGRPRQTKTVSEKVKKGWIIAARKIKKEKGMSIEEIALRMLLDPDIQDTVKASIIKIYNDALIVKTSETTQHVDHTHGPAVGLPPVREDPAKLKVVK